MFELIILIVLLIADIIVSCGFRGVAKLKGHSEMKYFWYCFFFTLAGWIMVVALPDRGDDDDEEESSEEG